MTQTQPDPAVVRSASDNKRLDEWVGEDRLDLRRIQFPRKDKDAPTTTTQCTTTGLNTPKKVTMVADVVLSRLSLCICGRIP